MLFCASRAEKSDSVEKTMAGCAPVNRHRSNESAGIEMRVSSIVAPAGELDLQVGSSSSLPLTVLRCCLLFLVLSCAALYVFLVFKSHISS